MVADFELAFVSVSVVYAYIRVFEGAGDCVLSNEDCGRVLGKMNSTVSVSPQVYISIVLV